MSKVAIIGCGVVGAAIAYELSRVPGLKIAVIDKQLPAQGATSAALGVLMGIISQKVKGRNWQLRETSLQRYETLIPELEALTGRKIPFNRQGIIRLCFQGEEVVKWEKLAETRRSQGYNLEIWDVEKLQAKCPHLIGEKITAAIYSPRDRQIDPTALTHALVDAAQRNGVTFEFGVAVEEFEITEPNPPPPFPKREGGEEPNPPPPFPKREGGEEKFPPPRFGEGGRGERFLQSCRQVIATSGKIEIDWLVVASGLGSVQLTASLNQLVDIRPVLGQALQVRLAQPMGNADFQPVITGDDVNVVPLNGGDYWVGATVEFPANGDVVVADARMLEEMWQQAIAICPPLAAATIIKTWSGLRPRPEKQAAPIIGYLPGYSNVLLATGHYRNGILLAPATALEIKQAIAGKN